MGLIISFGIRVSGVLLIFAMLIIPAVVSLLFVKNIKKVFFVAIFINLISVFVGLYGSFQLDLPSGPTIVAVLMIPLVLGQLYKWILGK
jgi:ABC-type Mn2+/Zn2+ transport system permease subunit